MSRFDASVIIPTYNRKESLQETLVSLSQQRWPADRFEVIVVDDGSSDGTEEIVKVDFPFQLQYIRQANQGSAVARNTGAEQAQGNILVFLDDDMLVEPDYITGLIEEHQHYPRVVGMGTELPYNSPNATPFAQMIALDQASEAANSTGTFVEFTKCVTNNLSVERNDFFDIGMMEDVAGDGPTWWGDVDFGYRANRLGFRFRRSGKATCYHLDYSMHSFDTASNRVYKAAYMSVALFRKFPDIQPHIPMLLDKAPIAWGQDSLPLVARKVARGLVSWRPVIRLIEQITRVLEQHYPSRLVLHRLYLWICGGYMYWGYREGLHNFAPVGEKEVS